MLAVILTCGLQVVTLTSCVDSVDNPVTPVNPGEQTAFTTKQLPVNRYGEASGTVNVRFYNDMPSVPYISVADFQSLVKPGTTVSVTKTGDGLYRLQNAGGNATVNTTNDTMTFDDYMAFTNLMDLLQPGMDNVYYDGGPFVRYNHQTLTGGSSAVTFDYGKYAIDLRGDDTAVYFPFTTLADLYADLTYHNLPVTARKWWWPSAMMTARVSKPWTLTSRPKASCRPALARPIWRLTAMESFVSSLTTSTVFRDGPPSSA